MTNLRDFIPAKLSGKTAEHKAKSPVAYSTGDVLLPGEYTIKVLARDDAMGHIGTFQTTFVIPNLTKETKRVPMTEAIYNAIKGKELAKEIAADPLVQNGVKLIPSVTRVSNKGLSMYVYLQAYEGAAPARIGCGGGPAEAELGGAPATVAAPAPTVKPLIAFVIFFQKGTKCTRPSLRR